MSLISRCPIPTMTKLWIADVRLAPRYVANISKAILTKPGTSLGTMYWSIATPNSRGPARFRSVLSITNTVTQAICQAYGLK